jgi:hypothetical protein
MKRVDNKGNMPAHVAAFAKQLSGVLVGQKETEFWEAANITEFEKQASETGYEIVPAMDMSTGRGYLVGFDVEESPIKGINQSYAQLKMYFVEVSTADFSAWVKKIKEHRADQELDSAIRKGSANKSLLTPKEGSND